MKKIEAQMCGKDLRFVLLSSRFNDFIVERLVSGAVDYLVRHGVDEKNITQVVVPGAFEMPVVAKKLAGKTDYDGIICLGAIIRGGTPHFDFVASECVKGLASVSLDAGIPVGLGILTCDNLEQAIERAGTKGGNKGVEAASAVLETVQVLKQL